MEVVVGEVESDDRIENCDARHGDTQLESTASKLVLSLSVRPVLGEHIRWYAALAANNCSYFALCGFESSS